MVILTFENRNNDFLSDYNDLYFLNDFNLTSLAFCKKKTPITLTCIYALDKNAKSLQNTPIFKKAL